MPVVTLGPLTDEEFVEFCAQHPNVDIEVSATGVLEVRRPGGTMKGARNQELGGQLCNWADRDKRGITFDSSTGWVLPNGARRSPDGAWVSKSRIRDIDPAT